VKCAVILFVGRGVQRAPYISPMHWWLDFEVMEPLNWTPNRWLGLTVRRRHEVRVCLSACCGVGACCAGFKVSFVSEEVFGGIAGAARVEAGKLFIRNKMKALVRVGGLDVNFRAAVRASELWPWVACFQGQRG
jgi:hypothetical protein